MRQLLEHLTTFISQNLSSEDVGVLYSGGIDSSIILRILIDKIGKNRIKPVTVGVKESYDIYNALDGAQELGINLDICYLDFSRINSAIDRIGKMNAVSDVGKLAIAIPLFLGLQFLNQNNIKLVFLGQGADELFGGYKKYADLHKESKDVEIKEMMKNDLASLLTNQMVMEKQIAKLHGITLMYPFLSPNVITFAQSVPISEHIVGNKDEPIRKALLRKLSVYLDFSSRMSNQPKKALQYGSGTVKLLRKIAKDAGYPNLPIWFQKISQT
ncbi:MAG: asparagine synthase C-terminal domain-containing protein [Candidatus Hodarchaeales archaeon]|jgi:asparagine synthase (glutamine-hydrolysing)